MAVCWDGDGAGVSGTVATVTVGVAELAALLPADGDAGVGAACS